MGDLKEMTYPEMLVRFRERRNESKFLLPLMSEIGKACDILKNVQSCLSIGPGPGEYDIEFMKRCLPNLRKLVAVEKDHFCAEDMKANIAKAYNGVLKYQVVEADVEDFAPKESEKFDIVLMFHMLYDLKPDSRKKLLKTALEQWIEQKSGILAIINMSDDLDERNQPINIMQKIHKYFNDRMDLLLEADDIRDDLKQIGCEVVWSQKYRCDMDFRVYDNDVTQLFNFYSRKIVDSDTMKKAITVCEPSKLGTYVGEILLIKKNY